MSIDSVVPSNHLIAFNLSQHQGLFQWTGSSHQVGQSIGASASVSVLPKNIQDWFPSRMDWFDLLAVQGTLKSLLQHHSSKASILRCSAFFMVQLSHLHMTTGKIIALTIQNFVRKVTSLLFNMLSRFFMAFLPRSKHLLILWQALFINNWYHWSVWAAEYHTIRINSKFNPPSNMPPDSQEKQPWGKILTHTKLLFLPRSLRDNPFPSDCQWSNYQKLCTVSDCTGEYKYMCAGKSHGRRSLEGCSPWGRKESDTTEWLHFHFDFAEDWWFKNSV